MSKTFLKIKIKSLAEEARIIRKEERKQLGYARATSSSKDLYFQLRDHRKEAVRREARSAQLAYGFLRGRAYLSMEPSTHTAPDWETIERLICRYGGLPKDHAKAALKAWRDGIEAIAA